MMNIFRRFYCRTFQTAFKVALPFLPYRQPRILKSNGEVIAVLKRHNKKSVMLVTDKSLRGLKLTSDLEKAKLREIMNIISNSYNDLLLEYYGWCRKLCEYCIDESKKK